MQIWTRFFFTIIFTGIWTIAFEIDAHAQKNASSREISEASITALSHLANISNDSEKEEYELQVLRLAKKVYGPADNRYLALLDRIEFSGHLTDIHVDEVCEALKTAQAMITMPLSFRDSDIDATGLKFSMRPFGWEPNDFYRGNYPFFNAIETLGSRAFTLAVAGKYDQSASYYQRSLDVAIKVAKKMPDTCYQRGLWSGIDYLCTCVANLPGQRDLALAAYRKALTLADTYGPNDPIPTWREDSNSEIFVRVCGWYCSNYSKDQINSRATIIEDMRHSYDKLRNTASPVSPSMNEPLKQWQLLPPKRTPETAVPLIVHLPEKLQQVNEKHSVIRTLYSSGDLVKDKDDKKAVAAYANAMNLAVSAFYEMAGTDYQFCCVQDMNEIRSRLVGQQRKQPNRVHQALEQMQATEKDFLRGAEASSPSYNFVDLNLFGTFKPRAPAQE